MCVWFAHKIIIITAINATESGNTSKKQQQPCSFWCSEKLLSAVATLLHTKLSNEERERACVCVKKGKKDQKDEKTVKEENFVVFAWVFSRENRPGKLNEEMVWLSCNKTVCVHDLMGMRVCVLKMLTLYFCRLKRLFLVRTRRSH